MVVQRNGRNSNRCCGRTAVTVLEWRHKALTYETTANELQTEIYGLKEELEKLRIKQNREVTPTKMAALSSNPPCSVYENEDPNYSSAVTTNLHLTPNAPSPYPLNLSVEQFSVIHEIDLHCLRIRLDPTSSRNFAK
ncbi:hypothetical protein F0562_031987 [Nyssa sinensis]|uniref:Uncharacterized protein n=1 Tax=Nyssa sinensis TaxID=561372 RepID=A0A5J5AW45_9ASTE|nr:hypothetical protein F0562_031987 [Nyssa sinensis]